MQLRNKIILYFYLAVTHMVLICDEAFTQITPSEGARLNYTDLVFDFPPVDKAAYYQLELWNQEDRTPLPFHIQKDSTNVIFCNLFEFGNSYSWRYKAFSSNDALLYQSIKLDFSVLNEAEIDTGFFDYLCRGDLTRKGYVLLDQQRSMIDLKGRLVWRMPRIKGLGVEQPYNVRDLRMTKEGTFTAIITSGIAVEFDRDGNILWLAPGSQNLKEHTSENYHHDFRKLNNGNYMVLSEANEKVLLPVSIKDTAKYNGMQNVVKEAGKYYFLGTFGTIVEYDANGKEVWKWNSANYFARQLMNGWNSKITHLNAFYYDETLDKVYMGFRSINLILEVNRKTGKVDNEIGMPLFQSHKTTGGDFFALQHSIEKTKSGNLLVFNNDSCAVDSIFSSVVEFSLSSNGAGTKLNKKISLKVDASDSGKSEKYGSAIYIDDNTIMIGVGGTGRILGIDASKHTIIFDILARNYRFGWSEMLFYRSHFVPSFHPSYFSFLRKEAGYYLCNEGINDDIITLIGMNTKGEQVFNEKYNLAKGQGQYVKIPQKGILYIKAISNSNKYQSRELELKE